jgi:hypothetical protein
MKRLLGQSLTVVVVGSLASALTPACADNDQSIFVRAALAPPQNRQNGQCLYTSDPTQPFHSMGSLDAALRATYDVTLLVGSQLVSRADDKSSRTEPNRVHIDGAVVRVTDPNGGVINEFTSLGSSFIDPEANNAATYSPVTLTAIDAKTAKAISDRIPAGAPREASVLVTANIKVFGKTVGGVDVESGEFQFPVSVCKGCLVSFATGDDPAVPGVDCNQPLAEGSSTTALPCAAGQDEAVPCQLCRGVDVCNQQQSP